MPGNVIKKITVFRLAAQSADALSLPKYHLVKSDSITIGKAAYPYRLFFLTEPPREASWYAVFRSLNLSLETKQIPKTMVSGFVLAVSVGKSAYAVTGGIGHVHLKVAAKIEYRFGIELAERILSLPELRGLAQKDTSGNVISLDRVFRGIYNPVDDLNNLKRVLKLIRGTLDKKNARYLSIGRSIQATDALTVNGNKSFEEIIRFLVEVEKLSESTTKQITIPRLANIDRKSNPGLLEALDRQLVQTLCDYNSDTTINLFLDNEEVGYLPDRVTQFELIYDRHKHTAETFHGVFEQVRELLKPISDPLARIAAYQRMHLRVVLDDGANEKRSLAYFVCGDVVYNNDVYFFSNEFWYRASEEFLKTLDAELDNIEYLDATTLGLVPWDVTTYNGQDAEKNFNMAHKNHVVLDRKLVKVDAQKGGIEFCDLLGEENGRVRLVHVKHACGAELRALFAQGAVAAELYANSDQFRQKVHAADFVGNNDAISKASRRALTGLAAKQRRQFIVVYAIFDDSKTHSVAARADTTSKALAGTLTTFAKMDLLSRARTIREMSYGIAVTRIKPFPTTKGAK